jgi:hypothetical protein
LRRIKLLRNLAAGEKKGNGWKDFYILAGTKLSDHSQQVLFVFLTVTWRVAIPMTG